MPQRRLWVWERGCSSGGHTGGRYPGRSTLVAEPSQPPTGIRWSPSLWHHSPSLPRARSRMGNHSTSPLVDGSGVLQGGSGCSRLDIDSDPVQGGKKCSERNICINTEHKRTKVKGKWSFVCVWMCVYAMELFLCISLPCSPINVVMCGPNCTRNISQFRMK